MQISAQDRQQLEIVARTGEPGYVRRKALALLSLADGRRTNEVGRIFRVSRQSLYEWQRRYRSEGVEGLRVRPGRGRKGRADLKQLEAYVRQSPRRFGIPRTRWTLKMIAQVVPCVKGFSPYGVQKALTRAGFGYKRGQPRLHSPDPEYEAKKGRWRKL
jgi:transposase